VVAVVPTEEQLLTAVLVGQVLLSSRSQARHHQLLALQL